MDSMEQIVRQRLSQESSDELKAYVDARPEIKTEFEKLGETYANKIQENIEQGEKDIIEITTEAGAGFDSEEAKALNETIQRIAIPFMEYFKSELSLDKLLKPSPSKDASTMEREWEDSYEKFVKECQNDGLQIAGLPAIDAQMRRAIAQMRIYDIKVAKLTGIAKEKGIEVAMQDDIQDNIIRELFPTKEAYFKHIEETGAMHKTIMLTMGTAVLEALDFIIADAKADYEIDEVTDKLLSVVGKTFNSVIKSVFDNLDSYDSLVAKITKNMTEKDANIIYDSAK